MFVIAIAHIRSPMNKVERIVPKTAKVKIVPKCFMNSFRFMKNELSGIK